MYEEFQNWRAEWGFWWVCFYQQALTPYLVMWAIGNIKILLKCSFHAVWDQKKYLYFTKNCKCDSTVKVEADILRSKRIMYRSCSGCRRCLAFRGHETDNGRGPAVTDACSHSGLLAASPVAAMKSIYQLIHSAPYMHTHYQTHTTLQIWYSLNFVAHTHTKLTLFNYTHAHTLCTH